MNEIQDHKCPQCGHAHIAPNNICGHQTIETIRVGNGRLDFGRGSPWREIVTETCRCDIRQGTEPFNPRYEMTEGSWELPDA